LSGLEKVAEEDEDEEEDRMEEESDSSELERSWGGSDSGATVFFSSCLNRIDVSESTGSRTREGGGPKQNSNLLPKTTGQQISVAVSYAAVSVWTSCRLL
jgi:hypothetical protein